jgi:hypothetical protein
MFVTTVKNAFKASLSEINTKPYSLIDKLQLPG